MKGGWGVVLVHLVWSVNSATYFYLKKFFTFFKKGYIEFCLAAKSVSKNPPLFISPKEI
jgi:hypothetical protein